MTAREWSLATEDFKYYSTDPLALFLRDILHLTPITAAILAVIGASTYGFISAFANHSLWNSPGQVGFIEDWSGWVWRLVFAPALAGYYLWAGTAIGNVFQSLKHQEIVKIHESDILAAQSYYKKPWREIFALCCAVVFTGIFFVSRAFIQSWASSGLWPKLVTTAGTTMGAYMAAVLSLTLVANVLALRRVLKGKEFAPNPLHPDKCGGLKFLSDYSLKTAYLAGIAGLVIGLIEYRLITQNLAQQFWYIHLLIPVYLAGASFAFFMPLNQAHTGMKTAKESLLDEIANHFQTEYAQAQLSLRKGTSNLKDNIDKIEQLHHLYTLTNKFPVWPFNTENLRRFIAVIISPLLPIVIGLVSQWINQQLAP